MRRPYGLYTDRLTKAGRTVLRAGNVIDSVGRRARPSCAARASAARFMSGAPAHLQARTAGRIGVSTGARLQFKFAHQQRYWWKFHNAARFELWRLDAAGQAHAAGARPARRSAYCLRDLTHTRPRLRRSPRRRVYPACSNNSEAQHVTLGTSLGLGRHLPARLPRAVDRRDRAARLLRLRAHRRPRERHLRVERGQQRGAGDRAAFRSGPSSAAPGLPRSRPRPDASIPTGYD